MNKHPSSPPNSTIKFQKGVSAVMQKCVASTAILSLIVCNACMEVQAQNNPRDSPSPTEVAISSQVVALGKLVPEGEVIKISVVNTSPSSCSWADFTRQYSRRRAS